MQRLDVGRYVIATIVIVGVMVLLAIDKLQEAAAMGIIGTLVGYVFGSVEARATLNGTIPKVVREVRAQDAEREA
jgi:hypothetical protein